MKPYEAGQAMNEWLVADAHIEGKKFKGMYKKYILTDELPGGGGSVA